MGHERNYVSEKRKAWAIYVKENETATATLSAEADGRQMEEQYLQRRKD